jgi:hypothetical protein
MKLIAITYLFLFGLCWADEISIDTKGYSTVFKFPNRKILLNPANENLDLLLKSFSKAESDEVLLSLFTIESRPKLNSILSDESKGKAYRQLLNNVAEIIPILLIIENDQNYQGILKYKMKSGSQFFQVNQVTKVDDKLLLIYSTIDAQAPESILTETLNRNPSSITTLKVLPAKE